MNNFDVLLGMKLGGGSSSTLVEKTITANGTYNPADDNADGYSSVTANVPNTYALADEGKVVDNGTLVGQTAKNVDTNGLYDTTLNNSVNVSVPNTYTVADEGKVVSQGDLVSQTQTTCDSNGTIDTTLNNSVVVSVPNTYTAGDEGKVVSSGALVSQTAYPSTIVTNGTYDTTLNNSVTVDVPPTPAETKSVVFYDYDGTELYSYTPTEFAALTELPANPTHSGLTAQGWNWTLADAKSYVADYKYLNIGQLYVTDDGKTRLYVHLEDGLLTPTLCLYAGDVGVGVVDWGDGSSTETVTVAGGSVHQYPHTYAIAGDYIITLTVTSGTFQFRYDNANFAVISGTQGSTTSSDVGYRNSLQKCEIGTNITVIGQYAFNGCYSLKSITIPNTVIAIGQYAFATCYSLVSVTIPIGISNINQYAFNGCYSLKSITIPNTVTSIGTNAFAYCYSLYCLTLPTITTFGSSFAVYCYGLNVIVIPYGSAGDVVLQNMNLSALKTLIVGGNITGLAVNQCYALQNVISQNTIRLSLRDAYSIVDFGDIQLRGAIAFDKLYNLTTISVPVGVTLCSFSYCTSIESVDLPDTMREVSFTNCYSLDAINIPNGVTTIMFQNCRSLRTVNIPNSVTSLVTNTFSGCYSLSEIEIPSSVTSIGTNAFANCYSLSKITINAAEGAVSGAPWGAPSTTQIVWTG